MRALWRVIQGSEFMTERNSTHAVHVKYKLDDRCIIYTAFKIHVSAKSTFQISRAMANPYRILLRMNPPQLPTPPSLPNPLVPHRNTSLPRRPRRLPSVKSKMTSERSRHRRKIRSAFNCHSIPWLCCSSSRDAFRECSCSNNPRT